jgi:hypothetical protein
VSEKAVCKWASKMSSGSSDSILDFGAQYLCKVATEKWAIGQRGHNVLLFDQEDHTKMTNNDHYNTIQSLRHSTVQQIIE